MSKYGAEIALCDTYKQQFATISVKIFVAGFKWNGKTGGKGFKLNIKL
jgi:hypothetical protein